MKHRLFAKVRTFASALAIATTAMFGAANAALAEEMNEVFLPGEVKAFGAKTNPYTTLTNEDLAIRADQMRDSVLSPSQRAMNYQWLSEHSGSEDAIHGNKAISKLLERQLKAYIDERAGGMWIKQKLMPDSSGQGFIKSVDYDLKLRSNKLVIGVTYEF